MTKQELYFLSMRRIGDISTSVTNTQIKDIVFDELVDTNSTADADVIIAAINRLYELGKQHGGQNLQDNLKRLIGIPLV